MLSRGNIMLYIRSTITTNRYKPIWEAKDIEEFKRIFIDCVECHYHAYTKTYLRHYVNDTNLMIYQPAKMDERDETLNNKQDGATEGAELEEPTRGVLLGDLDMAAVMNEDGESVSTNPDHHHVEETLSFSFMACDLLCPYKHRLEARNPNLPKAHLYRYDLESFFYILIFAASRYDLARGRRVTLSRESPLREWISGSQKEAFHSKFSLFSFLDLGRLVLHIRPEWKDMWDTWVAPLYELFREAFYEAEVSRKKADYDFVTLGGRLTYEKFMEAIGVKPRPLSDGAS